MKCCCLFLLLLLINPVIAQMLRSSLPVNYSTTGTYSQHFTDVFSFTKNQASLSRTKNVTAGFYAEKRFMLQELKAFSAAVGFPCWQGGAGIAIDYTGFANYSESHTGLAYGKSLGAKIDLGVQFNYNRISVAGYGSAAAINFEIGAIFHLTDKINAGCHIYNPVGGKFSNSPGEKLSSIYSFGTGYETSEKLYVGAEIIKEENQTVDFNVSIHYAFEKQFFIRGGISSAVGNYFAGAGLLWKNIRLDMAADWHPKVGLTPSLLMIFILTKDKSGPE